MGPQRFGRIGRLAAGAAAAGGTAPSALLAPTMRPSPVARRLPLEAEKVHKQGSSAWLGYPCMGCKSGSRLPARVVAADP